jgi:hypothetical protein
VYHFIRTRFDDLHPDFEPGMDRDFILKLLERTGEFDPEWLYVFDPLNRSVPLPAHLNGEIYQKLPCGIWVYEKALLPLQATTVPGIHRTGNFRHTGTVDKAAGYAASTTFTIPLDWSNTSNYCFGIGGGGGGGKNSPTPKGPGAGGGAYAILSPLDLRNYGWVIGTVVAVNIGAGGAGNSGNATTAGGTTNITGPIMQAAGAAGGSLGAGGPGGATASCVGSGSTRGGNGSAGVSIYAGGGGGGSSNYGFGGDAPPPPTGPPTPGAGSTLGGAGGVGTNLANTNGNPGAVYGGGGGGTHGTGGQIGGAGAGGYVQFGWTGHN